MNKPTRQDDCERMLRILSDAPTEGLSQEEIQGITAQTGETWSLSTINDVLCDIRPQINVEKVRVRGGKKTVKYSLKLRG